MASGGQAADTGSEGISDTSKKKQEHVHQRERENSLFDGLFRKSEAQAFPGDTYLEDMREAAKAGKPWAGKLIFAIVLCFFADLYFLHDTVDIAFDNVEGGFLSIYAWGIAAALVLLYLYIAFVFGKKFKEYRAFGVTSSCVSAIIAAVVLLLALFFLTVFRLSSELDSSVGEVIGSFFPYLSSSDYVTEISKVFVMTLMMALSAFLSSIYAYYRGDVISEAVYRKGKTMLPSDRLLYNRVFFDYSNDVDKEREYEARERELDRRATESAFKLGSIASQLNGMVDPADAYEFIEARNALSVDYFK